MSGRMSRNKGKNGEREVITLLQPVVTEIYQSCGLERPILQRNHMQVDLGGYDIVGLPWLAMEVKRHETLQVYQWWQQTLASAKPHQEPILIYRQNKQNWKVRMYGNIPCGSQRLTHVPVTISFEDFLVWFRLRTLEEINNGSV